MRLSVLVLSALHFTNKVLRFTHLAPLIVAARTWDRLRRTVERRKQPGRDVEAYSHAFALAIRRPFWGDPR